jgi:hypothetical protein
MKMGITKVCGFEVIDECSKGRNFLEVYNEA